MLAGDISPMMLPQTFYSVGDNFILLAVPMFLMMSNILLKAGVGEDLFNFAQSWVGNFPGGLAIATIVSCSILAAGGTLGILIPPSIPMIVYAFVVEESVLTMFLAGIGPGIMLALFFIIFSIFYVLVFNKEVQNVKSTREE